MSRLCFVSVAERPLMGLGTSFSGVGRDPGERQTEAEWHGGCKTEGNWENLIFTTDRENDSDCERGRQAEAKGEKEKETTLMPV